MIDTSVTLEPKWFHIGPDWTRGKDRKAQQVLVTERGSYTTSASGGHGLHSALYI